jgi:hypothetical protein
VSLDWAPFERRRSAWGAKAVPEWTDETSRSGVPSSGSGRASLFAALAAAGGGVLLLRLGSGHTPESQRFAGRPEFDVWTWILAGEVAAAAAAGIATWPAFRVLVRAAGRRAVWRAVAAWLAVGLLVVFGPRALTSGAGFPLWLLFERVAAATIIVGVFVSPSYLGLILVQARLAALKEEIAVDVAEERAGRVVVELTWIRSAMQRFLVMFALVISGAVLAAGALRNALIAAGAPADDYPVDRVLVYGGFFTVLIILTFVPAYVAWQERVIGVRDELWPVPKNGVAPHDWYQARSDFDTLLSVRSGVGSILTATFSVLAPLAGSLVTALIPT